MIPIAPEGYGIILITALLVPAALLLGNTWAVGGAVAILLFVISFFRDPKRRISRDNKTIYSPADGLVTAIKDVTWDGMPYHQVVIFLSVFNCHVNRIPFSGSVVSTKHIPGKFLAAFRGDIDKKNERQETVLDTAVGPMKVVQITGAIARRIICNLSEEQVVGVGDRMGLIRFGSRTDLYIPKSIPLTIKKGQHVKGGLTIFAQVD